MSEAEVEQWKPWPRDPWYELSNLGRVRSRHKVLKPLLRKRPGKSDVPIIETRCNGRQSIRRMVWEAWFGETERGVRTIDGDAFNVALSNLALSDRRASGSENKVAEMDTASIVAMHARGDTLVAIAQKLGVSQPTVSKALARAGVSLRRLANERTRERRASLGRDLLAMYESGMSWADITRATGIAADTITTCLRAAGMSGRQIARQRSEANGKNATQEQATALGLTIKQADEKARNLRKNYGLTLGEYIAIKERQSNKCAACRKPLGEERTAENAKRIGGQFPVVDHCHKTEHQRGSVRGILHSTCNGMLGMAREDREVLRRLGQYLDATRTERPMSVVRAVQGGLHGL